MDETILDEAFDVDAFDSDLEDTTVGDIYESIETNLWLSDGYFAEGASGLAMECLRSAWSEYVRFRDILRVYEACESGAANSLGERLVRALTARAGDSAADLALGDTPDGRPVWESLAAA